MHRGRKFASEPRLDLVKTVDVARIASFPVTMTEPSRRC
jgi:hypothetical protein